jgi:sugar (pentulose or hexulose) kinase
MTPWLVGLDIGTTSCKAVVMAPDGREVAWGRAPTPWTTTPLGTQTDGEALVQAARSALSDAVADAPTGRIVGVGVASMAESGVLIGRDGRPTAPVSPGTTPVTRRRSTAFGPSSARISASGPVCRCGSSGR